MANKLNYNDNESYEEQCFNLLTSLKVTVEWLLSSCSSNIWNTYGSLSRLCILVDRILSHGLHNELLSLKLEYLELKQKMQIAKISISWSDGSETYWKFVCGLRWLLPALAPPVFPLEIRGNFTLQEECFRSHMWLKKSLQECTLSLQLQTLILNSEHLCSYYHEGSFLRNEICSSTLLTCLKAIESNQPSLLASLNPLLVPDSVNVKYKLDKDQSCQKFSSKQIVSVCCDKRKMSSDSHLTCDNFRTSAATLNFTYRTPPSKINRSALLHSSRRMSDIPKGKEFYKQTKFVRKHQRQKSKTSCKCNTEKLSSNKVHQSKNSSKKSVKNLESLAAFSERMSEDDVSEHSKCGNTSNNCGDCSYFTVFKAEQKFKTSQRRFSYPCDADFFARNLNKHFNRILSHSYNDLYHMNERDFISESGKTCSVLPSISQSNCIRNICMKAFNYGDISSAEISKQVTDVSNSTLFATSKSTDVSSINSMSKSSNISRPSSKWKAHHSRSKSDASCHSFNKISDADLETPEESLCLSLPSCGSEDRSQGRKSIFEGSHIVVPTECFFPRPHQGQSLTSFLSSNDFNISAELDRENAHFCISEALISAIEHMKCTQYMKAFEEDEESDEEIRKLKQRIRIRRRERQEEKTLRNIVLLSDGRTDTTTSQSPSSLTPSYSSDFSPSDTSGTENDFEDLELSDPGNSTLDSVKEKGLSLSMASLYSEADIHRVPQSKMPFIENEDKRVSESNSMCLSAESVALSLLKKFSEKQLPKASDLEWLVSEQDAPQRLLPLPDSWPVSPDTVEEEYGLEKTRLRGNLEWAPPRAQIIFNIHPDPKRKDAIAKQKYRCAGCGMKVEKSYASKFRYCEYLGKFFCHCCHSNTPAFIPARIIGKWDFTKYCVSNFSCDVLEQMYDDPLFNIQDINSNLYKKVRQLDLTREYRIQLFYLKDYIKTCRNAANESIKEEIDHHPKYVLCEPHLYSLNDMVQVKSGELPKKLYQVVMKCVSHIMPCVLCRAKGFICETCKNETDIIFPFQLAKVCQCQMCGSCFHKRCYKPGVCAKCVRIEERRKRLKEEKVIFSSEEEI